MRPGPGIPDTVESVLDSKDPIVNMDSGRRTLEPPLGDVMLRMRARGAVGEGQEGPKHVLKRSQWDLQCMSRYVTRTAMRLGAVATPGS